MLYKFLWKLALPLHHSCVLAISQYLLKSKVCRTDDPRMPQVEIYLTEIEAQMLIYIIIYIKTFYAAAKIKKKHLICISQR